jgi:nitric oxide reductase NorQ protein
MGMEVSIYDAGRFVPVSYMETTTTTEGESISPVKADAKFETGKQPTLFENALSPFASDIDALRLASLRFTQSGKTSLAKRLDVIKEKLEAGGQHITVSETDTGELHVSFSDLSDVPEFIQSKGEIDLMKIAQAAGENMTLTGPAGSGKTLAAQYLAKVTNFNLIEVQGGAGASFERLIGKDTLTEKNGASVMGWEEAIVPLAMKTENTILYFDEPNSIPDDVRFYLHPAMDYRRTLTYSNGRTLKAKKGFIVIGAMNEGYSGTTILNAAFRDRSVGIPFDYLPKRKEVSLLRKRGADTDFAKRLVDLASKLRAEAKVNKQMRTPISTRALLQAVNLRTHGATELQAVNMAVLEKVPAQYGVEKKAVSDAITAHFGTEKQPIETETTNEGEGQV